MKRGVYAALGAAALLCLPLPGSGSPAAQVSTTAQRESVNVTIYNSSMALVHDRRRLTLGAGENRVAWRDVSAQIDAASALVDDVDHRGDVTVLEQNYNYDLLDPGALMNKYVGKEVVVVHPARFTGDHETRERAKILSTNGGIILQYPDRIETEVRGYIIYPNASYALKDRPTLELDLASRAAGSRLLDLSFMTGGLSWRVDYAATVSPDERSMTLNGTVTLSNQSGVPYDDARVQLVAGNVNAPPPSPMALKTIARVTSDVYSTNVAQENFFEYHLYTLPRPTTILDKQTKQVALLAARGVPIRKTLELRGQPNYYQSAQADLGDKLPVGTYISFENKGGDLGIPLPAGVVRVYKADSHGLSEFAGADSIDHTPRFETARLFLGNSFDVTARKKQTDFHQDGDCSTTSSYEVVISNAKDVPQHVLVVEVIPGDWQILTESMGHGKSSSSTANWNVYVPARGRSTLTYTARTKWC